MKIMGIPDDEQMGMDPLKGLGNAWEEGIKLL